MKSGGTKGPSDLKYKVPQYATPGKGSDTLEKMMSGHFSHNGRQDTSVFKQEEEKKDADEYANEVEERKDDDLDG